MKAILDRLGRLTDLPQHSQIPAVIAFALILCGLLVLMYRRTVGDWVFDLPERLRETWRTRKAFRRLRDVGPYDPEKRRLDPRWKAQTEADHAERRATGFTVPRTNTGAWQIVPTADPEGGDS